MRIETYLINLDSAHDRLASASSQLAAAGIEFTRLAAVNGSKLTAEQRAHYSEEIAFQTFGRSLSNGELGCFLSHMNALTLFLETSADHCLVLEDDLKIETGFRQLLEQTLDFLQMSYSREWYLVNLGNVPKKHPSEIAALPFDGQVHHLVAAHHFPVLTTGLLWSRTGAKAFLDDCFPIAAPVDQFLKDWCTRRGLGDGLAFMDPPVKTTDAESQIAFSNNLTTARRGARNWLYFFRKQRRHMINNYKSRMGKRSFDKTGAPQ